MNDEIIRCTGLSKRFGAVKALDALDFTVEKGRIVGLLGTNGAGKTTLIKILNGLIRPDEGEVLICGQQPGAATKKLISYLPDRIYFSEWMKAGDAIEMFTDFYDDFNAEKADEMIHALGLANSMRIKTMSKGMKEKLQLILVMSRDASLYVLDEPIGGVDPAAREFILETILKNYNDKGAVLISTHLITDVEQYLDDAIFVHNGKIVLQGGADEIREEHGSSLDGVFRELFRMNPENYGRV